MRRVPHSESKDFWRVVGLAGPRFSMLTNGGPRRPGRSQSNYMHALSQASEDTVRKAMAVLSERSESKGVTTHD